MDVVVNVVVVVVNGQVSQTFANAVSIGQRRTHLTATNADERPTNSAEHSEKFFERFWLTVKGRRGGGGRPLHYVTDAPSTDH